MRTVVSFNMKGGEIVSKEIFLNYTSSKSVLYPDCIRKIMICSDPHYVSAAIPL